MANVTKEDEQSVFMVCMNVINSLTHLILGAVVMCAFAFAMRFPVSGSLTQHIFLCVTGYIILMTQAILAFSPHTGWSRSLRQQDKKVVHWVMQVVGSLLAIIGSIIRISDVNSNSNFSNTSAHGIFGIIAMILTFISLIGGVANLFLKPTLMLKLGHSIVGSVTVFFVFLCLCLGFDTNVYRGLQGSTVTGFAIALAVFGLLGTLLSATLSNINKIRNR